ncbi:MAG TPA: hypothetical protein PK765_00295 [bacterium]|nr:hypothetical protein [bacterium]
MLFANIPDDVPERRPGIGLSLKVPKLHGVPIGGPFIDIVHRMGIIDDGRGPESVGAGIRLRINTLVALDGLSFRSLDLSDVRQRLTVRGR